MEIFPYLVNNSIHLISMIVLLGFSAFFSGSETAFFSLTRLDLEDFKKKKDWIRGLSLVLLERPRRLLVAILLGNLVVNVLYFSISAHLLAGLEKIGISRIWMILAGFLMLLILVIFGEVIPKLVAVKVPREFSYLSTLPMYFFQKTVSPVSTGLSSIARILNSIWLGKSRGEKFITKDELKMVLEKSEEAGVIDRDEKALMKEAIEFAEIKARETMTPRVDIDAFNIKGSRDELETIIQKNKHSKIPVYRDSIDNIIGIVHTKDFFLCPEKAISEIVRPAIFVPESKGIESLLQELNMKKKKAVVVVDEYGGTQGIVTIEDIAEEIVGEIYDEYEKSKQMITPIGKDSYLISADLSLREWNEFFKKDAPLEKIDTFGGFAMSLFGYLPKIGEKIEFENFIFTIKSVSQKRIRMVLLKVKDTKK